METLMSGQEYSNKGILVTGAGGFLAGDLLPRLLNSYRGSAIYLLLRAESAEEVSERRKVIVDRANLSGADAERIIALAGDIERPELGLGNGYDRLAATVSEIYHSAACTRFDQKLEEARRINVTGTENLLNFARRAHQTGHFSRFHHVSTAYVAGNRIGAVREDELDCGQDFFNTYEQSKFEAEMMLREARTELPVTIYRPSIIVGDSRTGRTLHYFVLYEPVKWFSNGQLPFLPCRPEVRLDIVPVDYVCDAMVAIGRRPESAGKTYHLTAGPENSIDMREMVNRCVEVINRYKSETGAEQLPPPEIITPEMVNQFEGDEREKYGVFFKRALDQMQRHMPYAVSEKIFDDSRTRQALSGTQIHCPPFSEYVAVIVRYALEHQFR
jgi:thioester reductase-like protein